VSVLASALAEILFTLGPSVEAAKVGTEHEGHSGWSMSSGLPSRVQCGCGQSLDDVLGLPPIVVWYMAYCHECQAAMPFREMVQRDEWADAHGSGTGHHVTRHEERR